MILWRIIHQVYKMCYWFAGGGFLCSSVLWLFELLLLSFKKPETSSTDTHGESLSVMMKTTIASISVKYPTAVNCSTSDLAEWLKPHSERNIVLLVCFLFDHVCHELGMLSLINHYKGFEIRSKKGRSVCIRTYHESICILSCKT